MNYAEFLRTKVDIAPASGFEISDEDINPNLFPHQKDAVKWAVRVCRVTLHWYFTNSMARAKTK